MMAVASLIREQGGCDSGEPQGRKRMAPAGLSRPGSANKRASRHVATAPVRGDGTFEDVTQQGGIKSGPWSIGRMARLRQRRAARSVRGQLRAMVVGGRSLLRRCLAPNARLLPSSVLRGSSQHVFSKLFEVF